MNKLHIIVLVAASVLISAAPLLAQDTPSRSDRLAEQAAPDAIARIDPTTGGPSTVVDPTLPQRTQPEPAAGEAPALQSPLFIDEADEAQTARGPAMRAIPDAAPAAPQAEPDPVIDSDDPFVIKSILPVAGTIRYGEWYWDDTRAPDNGKLVVTVDLEARIISVIRDGHEIGTAVALLGTTKHPTPLGTFPILTKEKDNISEKYNNAPMPWPLRLTWDGIAIHGSPVINGYASHGCIGVPDEFAQKLYAIAKRGDKVVITRGHMVGLGHKII